MGPFRSSKGNQYILVAVDSMSKWVKSVALRKNDFKVVVKFTRKHIFTRFGRSRTIISDVGNYFINNSINNMLSKYGVRYKLRRCTIIKLVDMLRCRTGK